MCSHKKRKLTLYAQTCGILLHEITQIIRPQVFNLWCVVCVMYTTYTYTVKNNMSF